MREQPQATGTWRVGFDLAAFVLMATIAGMAAAVTLASIALLLSSVVAGTPAATSGAPAIHVVPATPVSPTSPQTPPTTPAAPEDPAESPIVQTQLARASAPAH